MREKYENNGYENNIQQELLFKVIKYETLKDFFGQMR